MKVIIVEDEIIAKERLEVLLKRTNPDIQILAHLESVDDTVDWVRQNKPPDIAFFDIQLADATCFEIFERAQVSFPVIFLTAYDNYVMKAFENNAIHYILKPATQEKLEEAMDKVANFRDHFIHVGIRNLVEQPKSKSANPKRLMVRKGLNTVPLMTENIAYFFSEHKMSFAKSTDGENYLVDESLSDLEKELDSASFFRANRQYLIHINAVQNFRSTQSSKVQLELKPAAKDVVLVSKENAPRFRNWIKGM